jgi:hypothetical protein
MGFAVTAEAKDMQMKSLIVLFLCLLTLSICQEALGQAPLRAKTESDREVLLYPDHTWKYAEEIKAAPSTPRTYVKPASARKLFKSRTGNCGIWVDETKWKLETNGSNPDFEFEFTHANGDGFAGAIIERIAMPLDALKEIALTNIRTQDPKAKVISDEKRLVNGNEVLSLIIELTSHQVPITFHYYLYTGKAGSIQLATWTGSNLFEEYQKDFNDLLNGLELYK